MKQLVDAGSGSANPLELAALTFISIYAGTSKQCRGFIKNLCPESYSFLSWHLSLDLKPVLKSAKICDHFLHFEKKLSQKSQISNFTSMTFGMMTSENFSSWWWSGPDADNPDNQLAKHTITSFIVLTKEYQVRIHFGEEFSLKSSKSSYYFIPRTFGNQKDH